MPGTTNPENGDQGNQGGQGAGQGGAGSAGVGQQQHQEPKKLELTQEELDRIIAERVARAKPKDYDELVRLREEREAAAEQEKTDLQKARDAEAKAKADAAAATERANKTLARAAIIAEAATQNAADAEVIAALLAGTDAVTVEDDGSVKGAKQAVKKLLEDKPFLVKAQAPGASGGQFGGNDAKTLPQKIQEAEAKGDWATARSLKAQQLVRG